MPTAVDILKVLSQHDTLMLFNLIANSADTIEFIRTTLNMAKIEFCSRVRSLKKYELVFKLRGCYQTTSMGKVVYDATLLIVSAAQNCWKLGALDLMCSESGLPMIERQRLVESMQFDERLHELMLKHSLLANDIPSSSGQPNAKSHPKSKTHVTVRGKVK